MKPKCGPRNTQDIRRSISFAIWFTREHPYHAAGDAHGGLALSGTDAGGPHTTGTGAPTRAASHTCGGQDSTDIRRQQGVVWRAFCASSCGRNLHARPV